MSLTSVLLPEPDAPVTATSMPSGIVTSIDFRLFSRAPRTTSALPLPLRRFAGVAIDRRPERNCPVGDALHFEHVCDRPLHHDLAAVDARARAHLDDVIGGADGVFVVLDDDDGVADVAQAARASRSS